MMIIIAILLDLLKMKVSTYIKSKHITPIAHISCFFFKKQPNTGKERLNGRHVCIPLNAKLITWNCLTCESTEKEKRSTTEIPSTYIALRLNFC